VKFAFLAIVLSTVLFEGWLHWQQLLFSVCCQVVLLVARRIACLSLHYRLRLQLKGKAICKSVVQLTR